MPMRRIRRRVNSGAMLTVPMPSSSTVRMLPPVRQTASRTSRRMPRTFVMVLPVERVGVIENAEVTVDRGRLDLVSRPRQATGGLARSPVPTAYPQ